MSAISILLIIALIILVALSVSSVGIGGLAYAKKQTALQASGNGSSLTALNASNFATGNMGSDRVVSDVSLGASVRPITRQQGTPEITLVAASGFVSWDTAGSQSSRLVLTASASLRLPLNMINGFVYILNVEIDNALIDPDPVLTFDNINYRFANSVHSVTVSSIVQLVATNGLVSVVISALVSSIANLNPSHWYNTRLAGAFTEDSKHNVLTWKDFGSAATNLAKTGSGSMPLVANALNEMSGISFLGGCTLQGNTTVHTIRDNAAMTIFFACKKLTTSFIEPYESIIPSTVEIGIVLPNSTNITLLISDNTAGSGLVANDPDLVGNVKVLTAREQKSSGWIWENGHSLDVTSSAPSSNYLENPIPIQIGEAGIYISEVVIFNRSLTDPEVQLVFDELLPIYSIPLP